LSVCSFFLYVHSQALSNKLQRVSVGRRRSLKIKTWEYSTTKGLIVHSQYVTSSMTPVLLGCLTNQTCVYIFLSVACSNQSMAVASDRRLSRSTSMLVTHVIIVITYQLTKSRNVPHLYMQITQIT
jgi:hypothetical protein